MFGGTAARISTVLAIVGLAAAELLGIPAQQGQNTATSAVTTILRLPPGWQLNRMPAGPSRTEVALAPDGSFLVFSATPDGTMEKAMLCRRPLERGEAMVIPGTEAACMPSISPDGQWIAFWAKARLLKVAVKGGAPIPLCDVKARPVGLCWGPDGRIIFGTAASGLQFVPAEGGAPGTMTKVDAGREVTHRLPHALPGGKTLVFTAMPFSPGIVARVESVSLETGDRKVLIEDAADAQYVSTGHLIFVRKGALMAAPFSLDRLETTGPAVTVIAGLMQDLNFSMTDMNSGAGQYSVSDSGMLVYAAGGVFPDPVAALHWVDRSGRAEKWTAFGARALGGIRVSPDGRQVGFASLGLERRVGIYDIQRRTVTSVTSDGQPWGAPIWNRDGTRVAFAWSRTGPTSIWWVAGDGKGKPEQLTKAEVGQRVSSWSPDGKYLAFVESGQIQVLRMADRQVIPFATTKSNEAFPEFSTDGLWLAYTSRESGRSEVYVRSFPDGKRTLPISSDGGMAPMWGRNGRELFYWNVEFTKLMKVDISPGRSLSASAPTVLFAFVTIPSAMVRTYDMTPDGQRFLIRERADIVLPPVTELNLVRGFFSELRRLSPAVR